MKTKRSGLTVIEILVVVGIIAILIGILVPALTMVQKTAKGVKQKAQFTAIDLGLAAFRNDYGEYPPSSWWSSLLPGTPQDYCGAQKLSEALLGWDRLGFHPDSAWRADGLDVAGGPETYDPAGVYKSDPAVYQARLKKRRDRYIDIDVANAFQLGESTAGMRDGLFVDTLGLWGGLPLRRETYVLCDVYEVPERKLTFLDGRSFVPGTPILYYRANAASKTIDRTLGLRQEDLIYNSADNLPLINLRRLSDAAKPLAARQQHPLESSNFFYDYIRDPRVSAQAQLWPYRPDSYILISAGPDGLYGTNDDIRNFGKR